jgi:hypothetical protein
MAKGKKKKKPIVRLEMRWGGLFSLALVSFCLMLWMFLLGIWTGQTVLQRPLSLGTASKLAHNISGQIGVGAKSANKKPIEPAAKKSPTPLPKEVKDGSFYALQVSAFQDAARAKKAVSQWHSKGYKAFYLLPPEGSRFHRVFVGHINDLPGAKKMATDIEYKIKSKVFITLIGNNENRYQ